MIVFEACVYNAYVPSATAVYTGVEHMEKLAVGDHVGLFAVIDKVPAGGGISFSVQMEHSVDGINFTSKRSTATPELPLTTVNAGQSNALYGGEVWPTAPSLKFVRLKIQFSTSGVTPQGKVQLFAVVRDRRIMPEGCGCPDKAPAAMAEGAGGGGGERKALIRYGSVSQVVSQRRQEVASLQAAHPRAAMTALRSALEQGPAHLGVLARFGTALAMLTEPHRTELHRFAEVLRDADPHAANEMMRVVLVARGEE